MEERTFEEVVKSIEMSEKRCRQDFKGGEVIKG